MTVETRAVIRCESCSLVQFSTRNGCCRRCGRQFYRVAFKAVVEKESQCEPVLPTVTSSLEKISKYIGGRIYEMRLSRGIDQEELSRISGVSRSYLSRIENGRMTAGLAVLEKISGAFGAGLGVLFHPPVQSEMLEDSFVNSVRVELLKIPTGFRYRMMVAVLGTCAGAALKSEVLSDI